MPTWCIPAPGTTRLPSREGPKSSPHMPAEEVTLQLLISALEEGDYLCLQPQSASCHGIRSCGPFLQEEGLLVEPTEAAPKSPVLGWTSASIMPLARLGKRGQIIWKKRQPQNPKLSRLRQKETGGCGHSQCGDGCVCLVSEGGF